ncbi:PREDICTED: uncharacterized protein LOC105568867, partial [Vollenhovia emeryi]|uniref:uncharacterized protein LOC105568867 n=1 Tax=Vollenhovia emeryi TaxID=411798 RepID=UPI0005F44303
MKVEERVDSDHQPLTKRKKEGGEVEEDWGNLKDRVNEVVKRVEKNWGKKKKGGWWDEECRELKGRVKEELKIWRSVGGEGEEYKNLRRDYRIMCKEKKRKEREEWERELQE